MQSIKPAQATLNALNDGHTMNELAQAIHDATSAVRDMNKAAEVVLTIRFEPLKGVSAGLRESPIVAEAEVKMKLPKPDLPQTLFYIDSEGNPTRNAPERQPELGLTVHKQGASNE
jgi:hypothetical protein